MDVAVQLLLFAVIAISPVVIFWMLMRGLDAMAYDELVEAYTDSDGQFQESRQMGQGTHQGEATVVCPACQAENRADMTYCANCTEELPDRAL
jgi:uncharacterized paraquat-inducible protein A